MSIRCQKEYCKLTSPTHEMHLEYQYFVKDDNKCVFDCFIKCVVECFLLWTLICHKLVENKAKLLELHYGSLFLGFF